MRIKTVLIFILVYLFITSITTIAFADVRVRGYYRKDGTYVSGHWRSNPDGNPYNNWSYPGNINPYTGKVAPGNPSTYLENYYGQNSTSGSYDSYPSDNQPSIVWLSKPGDSEESKDESEAISESLDLHQTISEWLENMRKNEEFEVWLIRYSKERGGLSQHDISRIYFTHLTRLSATVQEFIEYYDRLYRRQGW